MLLFALDSAGEFGQAVARTLGIEPAPHEERDFEDGEHKARPLTNVGGGDVYVVQPLYGEAHKSVDDKLVRLLLFIGSLVDAYDIRQSGPISGLLNRK